jgi:hypothetical protein
MTTKDEQKFSPQNNSRLERRNKNKATKQIKTTRKEKLIRGTNADYKKGTKKRCGMNHDQDGKKIGRMANQDYMGDANLVHGTIHD